MSSTAQAGTRTAQEVIRHAPVSQAPNGVCFAAAGETAIAAAELERMVAAVPRGIARALVDARKAYYFVPLAVNEGDETLVADRYDVALSDRAVCHRNLTVGDAQCVFISTRLMDDKFSVAFEFYINVGHAFVERAGVAEQFADLAWKQVEEGVRGETSLDAHDARKVALPQAGGPINERARNDFLSAAFADAIAIYMLSLYLDVDYYELREREYPLLAPPALAERLKQVAALFPPDPGFEFNVFYRRKS
ncbi:MAG TPA: hypothetical protein VLA96_05800 [Terriglobales bacterium]|nr:hypothetical protein [Terriglobales bacterium]